MKDLSYTRIFPTRTVISHSDALTESVKSKLSSIIMEENIISEKSHSMVSKVLKVVDSGFTDSMLEESLKEYESGKRIGYIAEVLYDKYFKSVDVNESINESMVLYYKEFR